MKKNVAIGALSLAVLVLLALDARHRGRHRILSERGPMVRQAPPPALPAPRGDALRPGDPPVDGRPAAED